MRGAWVRGDIEAMSRAYAEEAIARIKDLDPDPDLSPSPCPNMTGRHQFQLLEWFVQMTPLQC